MLVTLLVVRISLRQTDHGVHKDVVEIIQRWHAELNAEAIAAHMRRPAMLPNVVIRTLKHVHL
eukprot:2892909-Amphidinium_carterae.1